jgi:hypothetical protein
MQEALLWFGIRMFLGLPDPDPPLFCTYPDLDPDPSITRKKSKKTLISTTLRLLFDFLSTKTDVNVNCKCTFKKKKQKSHLFSH